MAYRLFNTKPLSENQCWLISIVEISVTFQLNATIVIQKDGLDNICKLATILYQPQCIMSLFRVPYTVHIQDDKLRVCCFCFVLVQIDFSHIVMGYVLNFLYRINIQPMPHYYPFVWGNQQSSVDSHKKGQQYRVLIYLLLLAPNAVKQIVDQRVIWDALALMWHECNVDLITVVDLLEYSLPFHDFNYIIIYPVYIEVKTLSSHHQLRYYAIMSYKRSWL